MTPFLGPLMSSVRSKSSGEEKDPLLSFGFKNVALIVLASLALAGGIILWLDKLGM